jgi:hypothetical protein
MIVEISWTEFKTFITSTESGWIYTLEPNGAYAVYVTYSGFILKSYLVAGTADYIDFNSNYKSLGNKKITSTAQPFAAKTLPNGKKLYKRVHGVNATIVAGQTTNIDFIVPYNTCKFSGAEIFGCDLGDTINYYVLDTTNNTYSGAPGSNYQLNQFGFNVEMPSGEYENTSNYDADLYLGMVVRCQYTNNGQSTKYISSNLWLHEVKD